MPTSTAADQPNKRQRSRTGCLTCRRRKVKCDEFPGVCNNCRTFGIQCEWATSTNGHNIIFTPQHVTVVSGNPSRRPACDACRTAKTRCDRDVPSCQRCREDKLECVYGHRRRRAGQVREIAGGSRDQHGDGSGPTSFSPRFSSSVTTSPHTHRAGTAFNSFRPLGKEDKLYSRAELTRHLDAFFKYVHPEMAMSFIHRGQLYRRLEESWAGDKGLSGQAASPLLLKCMAAVSARFLDDADASHPDGGMLPEQWAKEAKMAITLELDRFSISKLAATLCLIHHEYCSGRIGSAWTWTALATRMCVGMSLHLESPVKTKSGSRSDYPGDWTEGEARRRMVWATVCADAWSACGLSECTTFDRRLVDNLPLPCTEREFAFGHGQGDDGTGATLSSGLAYGQLKGISANHIWLTMLGSDVQWYLKHISDDLRPWQPDSPFHQLRKRLDSWISNCPPDIQFNVSNMYARKDDPDFGAWLHIHLHADQIGFVLRCFTMPGYEDTLPPGHLDDAPPGWVDQTREACASHARSLAEKVHAVAQRFPNFVPANWTWNIFVYGSVREQLAFHTLSNGRQPPSTRFLLSTSPRTDTRSGPGHFEGTSAAVTMEDGLQAMIFLLYRMTMWFDQNHRIARDMLRMVMNQGIDLQAEWIDQLRTRMSGDKTPGQVKSQVLTRMPFLRRYIRHPEVDDSGEAPDTSGTLFTGPAVRSIPSSNARQFWTQPSGGTRSSHSFQTLLNSQVAPTSPVSGSTGSTSKQLNPAEPHMSPFNDLHHATTSAAESAFAFDLFDILNDPSNGATLSTTEPSAPAFALPWQQAPHFGIMGNDDSYLSLLDLETLNGMIPMSEGLDQEGNNML